MVESKTYKIDYKMGIFIITLFISQIIKAILFFSTKKNYSTYSLYTDGISTGALIFIFIFSFIQSTKYNDAYDSTSILNKIISIISFILLITNISLSLIQKNIHFKDINSGDLPNGYYNFETIQIFTIIIQIISVLQYISLTTENNNINTIDKTKWYWLSIILSIINLGLSGIIYTILEFFTTQG